MSSAELAPSVEVTAIVVTPSLDGLARGAAVDLTDLLITNVDVEISGGSNVEANVSDEVRGSVSGGARLRVLGDGDVRVDTSGGATVDAG